MYDRIAPLAPTHAPPIIRTGLFKVKPIPAAAHPEYEFNIDTTTGMSAPPIGIISVMPNTSATDTIAKNAAWLPVRKYATPNPIMVSAKIRFNQC